MNSASHPASLDDGGNEFAALVTAELNLAFDASGPPPVASTSPSFDPPAQAAPSESGPLPVAVTNNPPKGYQRPDVLVLDDIAQRFAEDPDVEVQDVEVTCNDGIVAIGGAVPYPADRLRLEVIAATTIGVVDVDLSGLTIERNVDAPDAAALTEAAMGKSHENLAVTAAEPIEDAPSENDPVQELRGRSSLTERE